MMPTTPIGTRTCWTRSPLGRLSPRMVRPMGVIAEAQEAGGASGNVHGLGRTLTKLCADRREQRHGALSQTHQLKCTLLRTAVLHLFRPHHAAEPRADRAERRAAGYLLD